jgi:catechol 2,3-dioxygenase-like lactoylglutathione lyase family enzyme
MRPRTLDHIAFWVASRGMIADRCQRWLGMHVIDRQAHFTLLGSSARHGKLTLFDAEGPRQRGVFVHVGLRVTDLEAARRHLPPDAPDPLDIGEGIGVRLVEGQAEVDYDLDHVTLLSPDPAAAVRAYERLGFSRRGDNRVEVGGAMIELLPGTPEPSDRPLLNHLAVLVDSAETHRLEAIERGIEVESAIEATNTRAVFLLGPDAVRVEYVEHKPSFSLV